MYVCMYVCVYVCMYVCLHACMHACMYVCRQVCMHACMYVSIYAYTCIWLQIGIIPIPGALRETVVWVPEIRRRRDPDILLSVQVLVFFETEATTVVSCCARRAVHDYSEGMIPGCCLSERDSWSSGILSDV